MDLYAPILGPNSSLTSRAGICALKTSPVFKLGRILPRPNVGLGDLFGDRTARLRLRCRLAGEVALWSQCRRSACGLRVLLVVLLTIPSPPFSFSMFNFRPVSTRSMVWRRSCVLPLSCLKCRAARLCTHRREGCPLRHRESSPVLVPLLCMSDTEPGPNDPLISHSGSKPPSRVLLIYRTRSVHHSELYLHDF